MALRDEILVNNTWNGKATQEILDEVVDEFKREWNEDPASTPAS